MTHHGKWHGDHVYFGLHYDLHANANDTDLGAHCDPDELEGSLRLMAPQWVQTDCKGHPGMTSWYSQVPHATVSPGVVRDALLGWREATRRMGAPLHCHYSGLWDSAAAEQHQEWRVVPGPHEPDRVSQKLCPRRGYLEGLLLPQMLELVDRYGVDGFWVDGEVWALEPCYCDLCRAAYTRATGIEEPPTDLSDPNWVAWMESQRAGFLAYVTRYTEAMHAHNPNVLICSNWLQTFRDPGEPAVPTDWVSGDWWLGTDMLRCEARFIATRGKPWDLMLWAFHKAGAHEDATVPWTFSSVMRLKQQAATVLAQGGNLQIYEHPAGLRDGRLADWRMRRLGDVGEYVKACQELCQGAETIPQVAVLHSEAHYRAKPVRNLYWDYDVAAVEGAVYSLLESSYSVDILDEWALLPRLGDYPVVVAPEQEHLSDRMASALQGYVRDGGRLLITGAAAYDRYGADFLGAESEGVQEGATYHVPVPAAPERANTQVYSPAWRLLRPAGARSLGALGVSSLLDDELLPSPAATVHQVGRGRVAYVPCDLFHFYQSTRYPLVRGFVSDVVGALEPRLEVVARAPACVDVVLRRQNTVDGARTIVHLLNMAPMVANLGRNIGAEDLPLAGPITLRARVPREPSSVRLALEEGACSWSYSPAGEEGGVVAVEAPNVRLHAAIVIE